MMISMMVAASKNWCIGKEGKLPWNLKDDLKMFKELTMNHHILMGRKTFESLPGILPGRKHLVLSSTQQRGEVTTVKSFDSAVHFAKDQGETELFIVGGASLFNDYRGQIDRIYLSQVQAEIAGDTFIKPIDFTQYKLKKERSFDKNERNNYAFRFLELLNKDWNESGGDDWLNNIP